MDIKKAILTIAPENVMEIECILKDGDEKGALEFLRKEIRAKKEAGQKSGMHCHDICPPKSSD